MSEVATAAVEPEINAGHPPNKDVISDTIIVECNPTDGGNPNMNANAIASGIINSEIVNPDIISVKY